MIGFLWVGSVYRDMRGSWKFCHRGSNFNYVFFCRFVFSRWGGRGSKYIFLEGHIGPPAKRHWNGGSLVCGWCPNMDAGLEALWFFRGSGPVVLRSPIYLWFFRGEGPDPMPPPPLWIRACGTDNRGSIGDEFSAIVVFWLLLISAEQCNKLNYQYAVK